MLTSNNVLPPRGARYTRRLCLTATVQTRYLTAAEGLVKPQNRAPELVSRIVAAHTITATITRVRATQCSCSHAGDHTYICWHL